ncbi:unnamed protein product [Clonostachys rhizophaga]|uniref:Amidohydrolase-related domain-containing protein n=1 Tax=Clonostachys rhizophaga TaxID=160324 RepID=A0A9N9YLL2_9HYPO|nr:unnamed protein product [Clonostachys rhizophaga]
MDTLISSELPEGSWDSHIHIIDTDRFESLNGLAGPPIAGSVWENAIFENSIGVQKVTIVQPTRYGNDNTAALQALAAYGPRRARAIVQFDPETVTDAELKLWDDLGVRGVRINFGNSKNPLAGTRPEDMPKLVQKYAELVKPFGWVLQFFVRMEDIVMLESTLLAIPLRVVIDHIGNPKLPEPVAGSSEALDPYSIKGFSSLINLLKSGNVWVKISAAYRFSQLQDPEFKDLDPLIKEILRADSTKAVFGTDWPHTQHEGLDIRPWVRHLAELTSADKTVQRRVFRDNASDLWDSQ